MNHILRLQSNLAQRDVELAQIRMQVAALRVHLASAKFRGAEADGTLRSQIQIQDVLNWVEGI